MKKHVILMVVLLIASVSQAAVYEDALGYWQFEGTDAQLVLDTTANANDLYIGNSKDADTEEAIRDPNGLFNAAMMFPYAAGIISSVDDLDDFDFQPGEPFSVSVWTKKSNLSGASYLACKMEASGNYRGWYLAWRKGLPADGSSNDMLEVLLRSENVVGKRLWVRSGVRVRDIAQADGHWVHLAMTYDGSCTAEGIKFYVNGAKLPTDGYTNVETGLTVTDELSNDIPLCLGGRNGSGNFGGMMDEVGIWGRLLSDAEVLECMSLTLPATVTLTNTPMVVYEKNATSDTFDIVLSSQPTNDVAVEVATSTADLDLGQGAGVSKILTFTAANWDQVQTVTVTAVDDTDEEETETCLVTFSMSSSDSDFNGRYLPPVKVYVYSNDEADVFITADNMVVDEQGTLTATYSVSLKSAGSDDVHVYAADSADPAQVSVSPEYLIFTPTNFDQPQNFTVTAVDDAVAEEETHQTTIEHVVASDDVNYDGIVVDSVSVDVMENECIPPYYDADINEDCYINMGDMADLASSWLLCSHPGDTGCVRP